MERERAHSITQNVLAGTLGSPPLFTGLLLMNVFLMGVAIGLLCWVVYANREVNTRMMLIDNTMRDVESVMISRGYAKPSDFTKPSGIGQEK